MKWLLKIINLTISFVLCFYAWARIEHGNLSNTQLTFYTTCFVLILAGMLVELGRK